MKYRQRIIDERDRSATSAVGVEGVRHGLVRRSAVAVTGGAVLLSGVVLWVTPLPLGIVLIPLGLVILATEFLWARRLMIWVKRRTGPFGRAIGRAEARVRLARRRMRPA